MAREQGVAGGSSEVPADILRILGNETRLRIMRSLGEAGGELSFTELRDRVGIHQGGEFNYHLNELVGHFVEKSEGGYRLRGAGRQVVQAMLAGTMTDDPEMGPTPADVGCPYCDSELLLDVNQEHIGLYCTHCVGARPSDSPWESINSSEIGSLGILWLPPAGVNERSPEEMLRVAAFWTGLEEMAVVHGICPRCSASIEPTIQHCQEHDSDNGLCNKCESRAEMRIHNHCTNCIYGVSIMPTRYLLVDPDVRAFLSARGIDPIADILDWGWEFEVVEIRSSEPASIEFAAPIAEDALLVTVDEDLNVIETHIRRPREPA